MKIDGDLPVKKEKCATCPFRAGSPYAYLAGDLARSALTEATRIYHSTDTSAIYGNTGKPAEACRGARDIQIQFFTALGVLEEPTDECWDRTYKQMKAEMQGE